MPGYAFLSEESRRSGAKIFFADKAHSRAEAALRGEWALKGESALVDSASPQRGKRRAVTRRFVWRDGLDGTRREQQRRNLSRLPDVIERAELWAIGRGLALRASAPRGDSQGVPTKARPGSAAGESAGLIPDFNADAGRRGGMGRRERGSQREFMPGN